jgi:predicted transcriptional regulator
MGRSWKSVKQTHLSAQSQKRARAKTVAEINQLTLKALRNELKLTQTQVSRVAEMTQSELSRVESRNDHLTSTLRRYVEALGGELEISAIIDNRRIKLSDA